MNIFKKTLDTILYHGNNFNYPYRAFGIFGLITYPAYYLIWTFVKPVGYENLWMRLLTFFLCIPLVLCEQWPKKLKKYLPLYYYLLITFCLPFFFTFLLLKNDFSYVAVLNSTTVVVLCVLLLDLVPLIIVLLAGCLSAWGCFTLQNPGYIFLDRDYLTIFIAYGTIVFFGAVFAHRKEIIQKARISEKMILLSSALAHELRTPLSGIQMGVEAIKDYFPALLKGYEYAKKKCS